MSVCGEDDIVVAVTSPMMSCTLPGAVGSLDEYHIAAE